MGIELLYLKTQATLETKSADAQFDPIRFLYWGSLTGYLLPADRLIMPSPAEIIHLAA